MQFYCFQFLVTNRQEPSHVGISPKTSEMCQPMRGGHDGGGGVQHKSLAQLSSFTNAVLQQNSYWFGLVVWFFSVYKVYKNNNTFR